MRYIKYEFDRIGQRRERRRAVAELILGALRREGNREDARPRRSGAGHGRDGRKGQSMMRNARNSPMRRYQSGPGRAPGARIALAASSPI